MDIIITFFRDVLDGPLYIVLTILNVILICSCIGYLGEQYLNKKKEKDKFKENYVSINNTQSTNSSVGTTVSNVQIGVSTTGTSVVNNTSASYSNVNGQNGTSVSSNSNIRM